MRAPAAIAAVLLPLLLAGCGDQSSTGPGDAGRTGDWRTEHVAGATSVDFPTLLVAGGDDVLALMLSDEGVLQSHLSAAGAEFEPGEPLDLDERYAALGDAVRLPDGTWLALGNAGAVEVEGDEELAFDPLALRSEDGLTWERVDVTGFTDAVELNDVAVVGDRVVAVGAYRTLDDPGAGGFEARAWTSADGRAFEEVALPDVPRYRDYDDESYAGDLTEVDGDVLASGRIGDTAALWRSGDAGATWTHVAEPALRDVYAISGLGASGSTVVASTVGTGTSAIRSDDGGATWEPVAALPLDEEAEGWAPLWSGAGRFFTLTGIDDAGWSGPEACYADIDQCDVEQQPEPRLVASEDGTTWSAVDLPDDAEVDAVAGTADGRTLVMVGAADGVLVHTWPAGTHLPEAEAATGPATVDLVTPAEGEEPEVGVRYHAPMFVHCGMDWLWFGGATWRRTDDGPDLETGAGGEPPAGWPVSGQTIYGYATVDAEGMLAYSFEDGTVVATYERRDGAPGCD